MLINVLEIAIVPVVVASITAFAMIRSSKRTAAEFMEQNTREHGENREFMGHLSRQIGGIDSKVDRLDVRLDEVTIWQAEHEKQHLTEGPHSGTL